MHLEHSHHFPRYTIGLWEEWGLHCHPGPTGLHCEGLLEDDLGVPEQVHRHAVQLSGGRKGELFNSSHTNNAFQLHNMIQNDLKFK